MEECITQPHNGVAWCKLCLHKFTLPRLDDPPLDVPRSTNVRSMYLRHLTGGYHPHLHLQEARAEELMVLMQHYKMQVPAELQDGSEEWPADLKLKWQHTVLLWNAMLQVSFDRERLATQRTANAIPVVTALKLGGVDVDRQCYCGAKISFGDYATVIASGASLCPDGCDYAGITDAQDQPDMAQDSGCECSHHRRLLKRKRKRARGFP